VGIMFSSLKTSNVCLRIRFDVFTYQQ